MSLRLRAFIMCIDFFNQSVRVLACVSACLFVSLSGCLFVAVLWTACPCSYIICFLENLNEKRNDFTHHLPRAFDDDFD